MKRYSKHPILGLLSLFLFAGSLSAQNQSVYFGIGLSTIRGETTDQSLMQEDYGMNYSLKYFMPFNDERFTLTFDASIASLNLRRDFGQGENAVFYQNNFTQSYLGIGLRYYLSNSINRYNPYQGQFLPFVGISVGGLNTVRNSSREENFPTAVFKKPVSDPTDGYEFEEGSTYEFNGQVEGGFVYVINEAWAIEGSGMARPGFSDTWDGIKGTSDSRDWFVGGGLGVHFRF